MNGKIGIGITTRNRSVMLSTALQNHAKHLPQRTQIIVYDDGSDVAVQTDPPWEWMNANAGLVRGDHVGIAAAKNHLMRMLLDEGCDYVFLFDDDAWPIHDDWYIPYLASGHDHLQASFAHGTPQSTPLHQVYRDDTITAYHRSRGYMLFYTRRALKAAGGMDTRFVLGHEHLEHSRRIHNLGLTLFPYADVNDSDELIHSVDAHTLLTPVRSSIDPVERRLAAQGNLELFEQTKDSTERLPFTPRDVVLTSYLTTCRDPQRNNLRWTTNARDVAVLLNSLNVQEVDWVVFYDDEALEDQVTLWPTSGETWYEPYTKVTTHTEPYVQRWINYKAWLMDHPQVRNVWCVDGTDVALLRLHPFDDIKDGILYCGWENEVCGKPWMLKHHEASRQWLERHSRDPLLNPGVIGGRRTVVMEFCDRLIAAFTQGLTQYKEDVAGDMGYANQAIRQMQFETGPHVTSLFKGYEYDNQRAIWRHK